MREGEDDGDAVETGAVVEGGDVEGTRESPLVIVAAYLVSQERVWLGNITYPERDACASSFTPHSRT